MQLPVFHFQQTMHNMKTICCNVLQFSQFFISFDCNLSIYSFKDTSFLIQSPCIITHIILSIFFIIYDSNNVTMPENVMILRELNWILLQTQQKKRTILFFYNYTQHFSLGSVCNTIIIRQKVAKSCFSYLLLP